MKRGREYSCTGCRERRAWPRLSNREAWPLHLGPCIMALACCVCAEASLRTDLGGTVVRVLEYGTLK